MREFDLDADALPEESNEEKQAVALAAEWKEKGNSRYKESDFLTAVECYTEAMNALPPPPCTPSPTSEEEPSIIDGSKQSEMQKIDSQAPHVSGNLSRGTEDSSIATGASRTEEAEEGKGAESSDETKDKCSERLIPASVPELLPDPHAEQRSIYLCNRAACYQQLGRYEDVKHDCSKALSMNPGYVKALMRRGQAYHSLEEYQAAVQDMEKILEIDPDCRVARDRKARYAKLEEERMEKLKTETLGKLKDLGNSFLGNFGLSCDNFKFDKDESTGSYNIRFER